MSLTALAFALAAWTYLGFQWTIRILVYPQFDQVADAGFTRYERMHQRRVSVAVGPLFLALGVTSLALLARAPAAAPRWMPIAAVALVGLVLAETGLFAVALHRRLSDGFDRAAFRRLLRVDSLRLVTAALTAALSVAVLVA